MGLFGDGCVGGFGGVGGGQVEDCRGERHEAQTVGRGRCCCVGHCWNSLWVLETGKDEIIRIGKVEDLDLVFEVQSNYSRTRESWK